MRSIKKLTDKDAGWDPRLDSFKPSLKHTAKRQLNHKLRQQQKLELHHISESEICVCCGTPLGDAELGKMVCVECSKENS